MTDTFATCSGLAASTFAAPRFEKIALQLSEHGYEVKRNEAWMSGATDRGQFEIAGEEGAIRITLAAKDAKTLFMLRDQILHIVDHADPELLTQFEWSGILPDQGPPANFRLAEVVEVTQPFPHFYRVTLKADNMAHFADGAMHFRLLLPPQGRTPVWPALDATGRTRFPTGEDQLHNPVYTFVSIDVETGLFAFDVFIHDGGRITEWARGAQVGDTIGMTGPGGGQMPTAQSLTLVGDETALPAIRRILALAAPEVIGHAYIEVGGAEDIQDLIKPKGITVIWLIRGTDLGPVETLFALYGDAPMESMPFLWCGAEKSQVQRARKHFRDTIGIGPEQSYFSGYWRKEA